MEAHRTTEKETAEASRSCYLALLSPNRRMRRSQIPRFKAAGSNDYLVLDRDFETVTRGQRRAPGERGKKRKNFFLETQR